MKKVLGILIIFSLVACSSSDDISSSDMSSLQTSVFETAIAAITQTSIANVPTITQEPTNTTDLACTDSIGCVTIKPSDPIHIGYALLISGPDNVLGIESRNGAEVAFALKGQVLGHDILFTGEDEGCSAEGGQAAAIKLVADPSIVAIIGTSCSSAALGAMPLISPAGMVMISPSATALDLTKAGDLTKYPGFLRTAFGDSIQGLVAANFAFDVLHVRKAATIHDGSPYAKSLAYKFAAVFTELGGTITIRTSVDPNQTDFKLELSSVAAKNPQVIYYPIQSEAGSRITRQAKNIPGLEGVLLMSADGMFSPNVVQDTMAGAAIEGLFITSPDLTVVTKDYQNLFLPKYIELFGKEPISIFHAQAYDAAMMILAAIEKVVVQDADGTLHIGRQALCDALYSTMQFKGLIVYTELKYNDDHDTGKFVDINRKLIKTWAGLAVRYRIKSTSQLLPILYYFNSNKRYGPIYTPSKNIMRGSQLFEQFLHINYSDVDGYLSEIGDDPEILAIFDKMYVTVRNQQLD